MNPFRMKLLGHKLASENKPLWVKVYTVSSLYCFTYIINYFIPRPTSPHRDTSAKNTPII